MTIPVPTLRMGRYKGRRFDQVPEEYLRGLLKMPGLWNTTRTQIEYYLKSKPNTTSKAVATKKDRLDYKPQYFKPSPPTPVRTEEGKKRFRELSRQVKERVFGD